MWFKKKNCIGCGFLGWREVRLEADEYYSYGKPGIEVTKLERDEARNSIKQASQPVFDQVHPENEEWNIFGCFRAQWSYLTTPNTPSYKELYDEVVKERRCPFYIDYVSSYKPEQHLQIQEKAKDREDQIRNLFWGAFFVALFTVIIEIVRWLFSR